VVFVTNAALLTAERYDRLKALGVDEFSVSLDFPDNRHDENRKIPGLFDHLNRLIPELTARGHKDFTLITAVTRLNYRFLPGMLTLVRGWGARYNLSMYTAGRTGNRDLCISEPVDLADFRAVLDRLWEENRKATCLFSSAEVLDRYFAFFANGCSAPGCRAGVRSLVVNPDGSLCPCAMKKNDAFSTLEEMKRGFVSRNACDECYISLRANTEKPFREMFRDLWRSRDRI
jgi:MoaA/NifB/PqqE/SkfB family radical SAM enzyme